MLKLWFRERNQRIEFETDWNKGYSYIQAKENVAKYDNDSARPKALSIHCAFLHPVEMRPCFVVEDVDFESLNRKKNIQQLGV